MYRMFIALAVLHLFTGQLFAQWSRGGIKLSEIQDFPLSERGWELSKVHSISADSHGGAYVVWSDSWHVFIQRVSSDGRQLWRHGGLVLTENGEYPTVVSNGDSGVFVAWESHDLLGEVMVQRLNLDGEILWKENGEPVSIFRYLGGRADIAPDGNGGIFVAWMQVISLNPEISTLCLQKFDARGRRLWGDSALVLLPQVDSARHPSFISIVSSKPADGFYAVWNTHWGESPRDSTQTYIQRIDGNGNLLWRHEGIALSDASAPGLGWAPSIVTDGAGGAFAAWCIGERSCMQHIDSSGQRLLGMNGMIFGRRAVSERSGALIPDTQGGAFIVTGSFESPYHPRLQHVDKLGQTRFNEDAAGISIPSAETWESILCLDGAGGVFILSKRPSELSNEFLSLAFQSVDSTGRSIFGDNNWIEIVNTVASEYGRMNLVATAPGEAMVVWEDGRYTPTTSARGIYIAKIGAHGVVSPVHPPQQIIRSSISLSSPFPNPASESWMISCILGTGKNVRISLADIRGCEIKCLFEGVRPSGEFTLPIVTEYLPAGIYVVIAKTDEEVAYSNVIITYR